MTIEEKRRGMTKLDLLTDMLKDIDYNEGRSFLSQFAGACSVYLTDEQWKSCLETAYATSVLLRMAKKVK